MKVFFQDGRYKKNFNKIIFLNIATFSFLFLALILEKIFNMIGFWEIFFKIIIIGIFFYSSYQALVHLYYTFWTFSLVTSIYIFNGIVDGFNIGNPQLIEIYIFALAALGFETYLLSSPIYYLRIRWWVYDFRCRGDVIIKVKKLKDRCNGDNNPGRLTDLRRGAGCVVMFNYYSVMEKIVIYAEAEYSEIKLQAEIVSVREYSFGRGYIYGVKFILEDFEDRRIYYDFL
ncbi:MAG: hypothetical protein HQK51_16885, partial [Oligoflexia bacterium]|nr:hypothetical protein [Oligoflexia bacterium]